MSTIVGWTPDEYNPPFVVFVDLQAGPDKGRVQLHVRERKKEDLTLGNTASVVLTHAEVESIVRPLIRWLRGNGNHLASCALFNETFGAGANGPCNCRELRRGAP